MGLSNRLQLVIVLLAALQQATASTTPTNSRKRNKHRGRRRNQQTSNGDKFDPEKDRPCLADDGTIVVPDDILNGNGIGGNGVGGGIGIGGGGGGRYLKYRKLQQGGGGADPDKNDSPWDSPWDLCTDSEDSDDDDALYSGGNSTSPNATVVPAPDPAAAPVTAPTLIPAPVSVAPTLAPTPQPASFPSPVSPHPTIGAEDPSLSPTASATKRPKIPNEFYKPENRSMLLCEVSVALPAFYRRDLTEEDATDDRELHSTSSGSDDEKEMMQFGAARRFRTDVGAVMIDVVMNATNLTVVDYGPNYLRRLQSGGGGGGNGGGSGSNGGGGGGDGGSNNGGGSNGGGGGSNGGGGSDADTSNSGNSTSDNRPLLESLLVISKARSTVELIDDDFFHDHYHGVRWWRYSIFMYSVAPHEDFLVIEKDVMNSTNEAIMSGVFFDQLRLRFHKLVAVSLPGGELEAMGLPPLEASSGSSPVDGIDVRHWDASRWVGLGLFAITILSTLALTKTAQHRRKKVQEQEDWGVGLATEKGMNQLLTYGWEYDGATNQVHAFDKSKLVYRDDDSLLIGGTYPMGLTRSDLEAPAPTELVMSSQNASSNNTQATPSDRSPSRSPSSGMGGSGLSAESSKSSGFSGGDRMGEF